MASPRRRSRPDARLLGISTRTAKAHVAAVIEKLAVIDRTQAVFRAFDLGLLRAASPKHSSSPLC